MIGTCHCGRVAFEVKVEPTIAYTCNCSYCSRRGWQHAYAALGDFTLLRGEDVLSSYRFGAGTTANYFCSVCGIHTHFFSTYESPPHYAYSLACCEGMKVENLKAEQIDGKSF